MNSDHDQSSHRPLIVGHRGARGLYPENTLRGFARAMALGVDAVELDVAVTADSVVVVSHEPRLNPDITRGPNGAWLEPPTPLIRSLTFEQLRAYDVGRLRPGSAYATQFPHQQPADGTRIPSLREVLSLDPGGRLFVEMKTSPADLDLTVSPAEMADLVVEIVEAAGATPRVMLLSFDWRGLRHLRRHYATAATGWLTQEISKAERRLWWDDSASSQRSPAQAVLNQGGRCWLPEFSELGDGDVAAAHGLGLEVIPWGVERPEEVARAVEWRSDGLITDRPDLAMHLVTRAKP